MFEVVQLAMGSIAQKYSLALNPKYRLPKLKYKVPSAFCPVYQKPAISARNVHSVSFTSYYLLFQ